MLQWERERNSWIRKDVRSIFGGVIWLWAHVLAWICWTKQPIVDMSKGWPCGLRLLFRRTLIGTFSLPSDFIVLVGQRRLGEVEHFDQSQPLVWAVET